jgi:CheY-like chemotaxis protein
MVSAPAEAYVLVVEPSNQPLPTLINHLQTEGYHTQVVNEEEGEQILAMIEQAPPKVVVLSAYLPVQKGWRLFHSLKSHSQTKEIPVLFYALEQGDNRGGMLSFEYMSKPLNTQELGQLLAQVRPLEERPGERFTILIVDDDPAILEMHSQMVQRQWPFYAVRQAKNGREALADMAEHVPNLVLLDLMMPELDGFELLALMRQKEALRHVPVIVLTANVLSEIEMERLQQGVSTVLKKGVFTVDETLHHIQNALDKAHKLGDEKRRLVRQAMAYIHEHFTDDITREDVAAYVGVSEGYLSRTFQDELGLAPITYLNRYRVNQAKRLLREGAQTITEIAHAIGFPDSNYFSRVFRREVGVSPKQFRVEGEKMG